ncbi:NHL repeat-containing protein 2 [Geodia barretti]|uniref:NHL repeat-containing protein 2 n=1 Tax=Geodia barretti TaxID=519541 RepID=A0AA35WB41_GEOBA|nr:NHL repeat-containing protein 2 [Geodia barretti]
MAAEVPPLEKKYVKNKISSLSAGIQVAEDEGAKRREILSHIKSVKHDGQFQLDDLEFPGGSAWFNSGPLSLSGDLRGKLVVLDFFTYCCINCMHVLPDLASLERAHPVEDGLVVVGVHSAKFLNEKVSENIENAVRRYEISHPVVNDSDIVLWNQLGVVCWPTLVVLGPSGRLLHYIIGEGHGPELALFVDTALEYYRREGSLAGGSIPGGGGRGGEGGGGVTEATPLRYPGKVVCGREEGEEKLYVSDTGHHRVVVVDRGTGAVTAEYGSGEPGLIDGEAQEARFRSPQGLVRDGDNLYVADTENHVVRKVDMGSGSVSTVTGTGVQGNDKEGGGKERLQEISSPWDLALGDSGTGGGGAVLYIAMAGTHQIWAHFLTDCTWIRGSQQERGVTVRFTGSGEEANRNNSYPHKACFAQPSGVTLTKDAGCGTIPLIYCPWKVV